MKALNFGISGVSAALPGIDKDHELREWAEGLRELLPDENMPKATLVPMMTRRRMSEGSRSAVNCALQLLSVRKPDACVFSSRHSELQHNYRILETIARDGDVSPTDFSVSVHNSAAGIFTILSGLKIPVSAVSAGNHSFSSGMLEASLFLSSGYECVLVTDFDVRLPDFYALRVPEGTPVFPFAVSLLVTKGNTLSLTCDTPPQTLSPAMRPSLQEGIEFARFWFSNAKQAEFCANGQQTVFSRN